MSGKTAQKNPSFYKLMIGNFTHSLPVPPAFMQKHGHKLPKNVKLRISSGGTWNVKLEKMEDQSYCFGCGWSKFAEDVGLKFGEFLLFWFVGESMFDVAVYKIHGYQREIPTLPNSMHSNSEREKPEEPEAESTVKEINPLQFEIRLKFYQRSRLALPKDFWMAAGLRGKESVRLVYLPNNCYEDVVLFARKNSRNKKNENLIEMGCGWPKFKKENKLKIGTTYLFEFKPDNNVIHVKEI